MTKINIEKIFFHLLPGWLLVFLPFFLITGPFLSDLAVSLSATIFLINSIKNKLVKFYNNFFFIFLFTFYLCILISSIFSNYPIHSLPTSAFYIRFILFSLSTWYLLSINKKLIIYFFYTLASAFTILLFDGFIQFFFKKNLLGWPIYETRISSFFGDELILGSYFSRLLPILFACFVLVFKYKNNFVFFISIILFALIDVIIFLSGERSAFFYLNFGIFLMILLLNNYKKIRLISAIISLIAIILISISVPKFKGRMIDQTIESFNLQKEYNFSFNVKRDTFHFFTIDHDAMYKTAILIFLNNKLLGVGPKLFRVECKKPEYFLSASSCNTHPHNTYIQLLSETGIIGFLFIFIIFFMVFFSLTRHLFRKIFKRNYLYNDFEICLLIAVLISLWPLIPTGNFFGNWLNIVYYLPIGFLLFSFENKKNFLTKKIL